MAEIIRMPRLSDTMIEGNIVGWQKKVGDEVSVGDILAEVETDKATMDLESFFSGTLLHIEVEKGPVPVEGLIAIIGAKSEDLKKLLAEARAHTEPAEQNDIETVEAVAVPETAPTTAAPSTVATTTDKRIKASPLARNMAADAGLNLASIQGSGENGRIIARDIKKVHSTGGNHTSNGTVTVSRTGSLQASYEEVPVSQMRKVIARRLGESKFAAPHFYLTMAIDMARVWDARKQMNAISEVKISFNDIIVKACAMALRKHPGVNASWQGDSIRYNYDVHIGVAVAIDEGLLVPVIQHTDQKSLTEISNEVRDKATRAKERKLTPEEMTGNTFTISNLGSYGIESFTAIINPPDAAILAVGAITQEPTVRDGQIVVGKIMRVTMSCDHRVIDGATGSDFLKTLKMMLEDPMSMLL